MQEVATAIQILFDDSKLATQLGKNGKRAVKKQFNWDNEALKMLQVYDELVKL